MANKLDDLIAKLPPEEQSAIAARSEELRLERMSLAELRKRLEVPQNKVAGKLNIQQTAVSRMENRANLRLGTLAAYIESLGGRLEVIATFADRPSVLITDLANQSGDNAFEAEDLAKS